MGDKMRKVKVRRIVDSPLEDKKNTMDDRDLQLLSDFISLSLPKNKDKDDDKKDKKKKKKKDKDKKKKDKKDKKKKLKKNKMDLSALNIYEEDDEEEAKKNDEFYQYRFRGSLILLKDILKEIDDNIFDNKKFLEDLKQGKIGDIRVKLSPMTISNQMSNVSGLISTKLNVVKQITDINKVISDFELKKATADGKEKKDESKEQNSKLIMDKMFDSLINFDMPEDPTITKKKKEKKEKKKNKDDEYDNIDDRIDALIESGEMELTDNEQAFKYEADGGVEIAIEKSLNTGKWNFIALNGDGDEVGDYPLPSKSNVGTVKFSENGETAKDSLGQKYNVYLIE